MAGGEKRAVIWRNLVMQTEKEIEENRRKVLVEKAELGD